jgi:hypothetical protein
MDLRPASTTRARPTPPIGGTGARGAAQSTSPGPAPRPARFRRPPSLLLGPARRRCWAFIPGCSVSPHATNWRHWQTEGTVATAQCNTQTASKQAPAAKRQQADAAAALATSAARGQPGARGGLLTSKSALLQNHRISKQDTKLRAGLGLGGASGSR